jgi:CheY-like chemotaxis protein
MTAMVPDLVTGTAYTVTPSPVRIGEVIVMPEAASIVFVVDDDVSVRESLELLIKSAGWQPETFSSAQEFLSRPRSTAPSCLVLDVTLPGLNGLELQERLAERTDIPIIFITGHGDIPMSGFSLGGMVAQLIAQQRPSMVRRMILVATAPRGGEDIMHFEKPGLAKFLGDPNLRGYDVLQKIFFAPTDSSQAAGQSFITRLAQRADDRDRPSGPEVAAAQMAAFREWELVAGERFADLRTIRQPTLVVNGVHDEMIPIVNSYRLAENLPNAVLLTYPDSGHGALFQFHESFTRQVAAFLASDSPFAPY